MSTKEKAIELVDRYYSLFSLELDNTIDITQAKKCALIALDEILDAIIGTYDFDTLNDYWKEVKQEIEKL
jgi:hypothetical protein